MKLLVEVARRGSFTDVANAQGIAPSSVSRAISGLEKELGFRLFQRSTRKLQPTEAGLIYLKRIMPLVGELESARHIAADINDEPSGTLRITAPVAFGQLRIVPLLPMLREQYTSLRIELVLTDTYLDLIDERIDIAIRLGSLTDSSHIVRRIQKMEFFVCASPSYLEKYGIPSIPKELKKHECLLFPRVGHSLNWSFKDSAGAIEDIPINGNCLITNSDAIRQSAVDGLGIALLPDWLVERDLDSGKLEKLFPDFAVTATDFNSAVWLLYPSRAYTPSKVRAFIDALFEHLPS